MANRYWVGGTGNWSDSTNHWSTTSGGSPAALQVPTSIDDVFIDSSSGFGSGGTITLDTYGDCNDFTATSGHSYTIDDPGYGFNIYGSLTFESGITLTSVGIFYFFATTTGKTITLDGVTIPAVNFDGLGGGWTLQDDLIIAGEFYQENGIFDANDHNVTANDFYFYADTGYTPTIIMGSGTWEATGDGDVWYIDQYSGEYITFTPETSTIKFTNSSSGIKTFFYYDDNATETGKTYNNLWLSGTGTGEFTIKGSNAFNDLKIDTGLTVKFTNNTTTTVTTFTALGSVGNLITLNSVAPDIGLGVVATLSISTPGSGYIQNEQLTINNGTSDDAILNIDSVDGSGAITGLSIVTGGTDYSNQNYNLTGGSGVDGQCVVETVTEYLTQHTLSKSSGIVECDYLDISNSNAIGGATWYARNNSADTTNNDGWIFEDAPVPPSTTKPLGGRTLFLNLNSLTHL